jgi:hypothetical protein
MTNGLFYNDFWSGVISRASDKCIRLMRSRPTIDDKDVQRPMNSTLGTAIRDILMKRRPAIPASPSRDKRSAERFPFRAPMRVRIQDTSEELRGWLRSMSANGIGFSLSEDLSLGTRIEIGFEDVNLDAMLGVPFLQGVVTRCQHAGEDAYHLGARFALAGKFVDREEVPAVPEEDLKKVREAMFD